MMGKVRYSRYYPERNVVKMTGKSAFMVIRMAGIESNWDIRKIGRQDILDIHIRMLLMGCN
jgi:hypothetical protein